MKLVYDFRFLTFPLLCIMLSAFFILFGISSTVCSSLSAGLLASGLSSRMLSVQSNGIVEKGNLIKNSIFKNLATLL